MPLSFAKPPADSKAVVEQGLRELSTTSKLGAAAHAGPPLQLMEPHPVYELTLDELDKGASFAAARITGWRYLLVAGSSVIQAAELSHPTAAGGGSTFNALTTGYAKDMEGVLAKAENLPEVQKGSYEIRVLRVAALYVTALWLKDLKATADRFLPVPPTFPPVDPQRVYDAAAFLPLLQTAAAEKLSLEQKLGPP
jgi:hypothetical protein